MAMTYNSLLIEVKRGPKPNSWLLGFAITKLHPRQRRDLRSDVTLVEIHDAGEQVLAIFDPTRRVEAMLHILVEINANDLYSNEPEIKHLIKLAHDRLKKETRRHP
jgi:hypothetical protein